MSFPLEPFPKRHLVMASNEKPQPKLVATATTLNHISAPTNQKNEEKEQEEEEDQSFRNVFTLFHVREKSWTEAEYFPPGYRFCPYDGELIVYYLQKKVNNEVLPHDRIMEVNLYDHNPAYLTGQYPPLGDKKWYFFTPRERKYPNGDRPSRRAGDGYWKATGSDKPVEHKNQVVGLKKSLVFYEGKPGKGDKTNWIMHEFKLKGPPRIKQGKHDMKLDNWVLCRVYKKEKKGNDGEAQDQVVPQKGKKAKVQECETLLEERVPCVDENDLVGETSEYDRYIHSPQLPQILQPTDDFLPNRSMYMFSTYDPQRYISYGAYPFAIRPPPPPLHHLDNLYFQLDGTQRGLEEDCGFNPDSLLAEYPNL
ncbi:hypothetical protein Vadar_014025 [Vaccinium darrowii]|uniref:Uncharacterized protein n=1 Tax=Vaccinium darrowii TaxID=229202 RepID=A0ACB7XAM3_9ERIC|nr:hypothetical protein Vadar_014025 [Vaccinium darrowii]